MIPIQKTLRVGSDGNVIVPVGAAEAGKEVVVTVSPAQQDLLSQQEWEELVDRTGGSISDPTFTRHEQGRHEDRQGL